MQHVIHAVVFMGALQSGYITGIGHHADGSGVALGIVANGSNHGICQVIADGALTNRTLGINDGIRKGAGTLFRETQHMECQTLSRLVANAGKRLELFDQTL